MTNWAICVNLTDSSPSFDKEGTRWRLTRSTRITITTITTTSRSIPATWTDGKRYAWLLGIIVPLAPFIAWGSVALTGWGGFYFFGPLLVFVAFPLLDIAIGLDDSNPPDSVLKYLEQDRYYRWCTYVFIPIQYAGLVLACYLWSSGDLSILESIGLALTMGVVGGIAINTAHELGHKRANSERWLSRVALAQTGYGHFFIEHNRGHHVRVATPEDPGQLAAGGELLGLPAAHGQGQPHAPPGGSRPPASTGSASRTGACATTSSAPGR